MAPANSQPQPSTPSRIRAEWLAAIARDRELAKLRAEQSKLRTENRQREMARLTSNQPPRQQP